MNIVRNVLTVVLTAVTAVLVVVAVAGSWATLSVRDNDQATQAADRALSTPHGNKLLVGLIAESLTGPKSNYSDVSKVAAQDPSVRAAVRDALAGHAVAGVPEVIDPDVIAAAISDEDVTVAAISFARPDGVVGAASDNALFGVVYAPWLALIAMVLSVAAAKGRSRQLERIVWLLGVMAIVSFLVSILAFALPDEAATLTMTVVLHSISASAAKTAGLALGLAVASGLVKVAAIFTRRMEASLAGRSARRLGNWDEYLTLDPHSAARAADHWTAPVEPEPFSVRQRPLPPLSDNTAWPPLDDK